MAQRINDVRNTLKFSADEVTLAVNIAEAVEKTIEMVYFLMERDHIETFVLMLMSAENTDLESILDKEKRDTDILFEVDKTQSTYVMLCQDTKVDGGYRFAERIISSIEAAKGTEIYCSQLEVRSTRQTVKTVLFKMLESFLKAKRENKSSEIIYKSLS